MAFPTSPTNGQTTTVNGTNYVYNSANNAWKKTTTTLNYNNVTWNTANFAYTQANAGFTQANSSYMQSNSAFIQANAAYTYANTAITTSGGSINGSLNVAYTPATTVNTALYISGANTKGGTGYSDFLKTTNTSGGATNPNKWFRLNSSGGLEIINSAYSQNIFTLTDGGTLTIGGSFTPATYTAGQVIKDTMLSNSEVTVSSTTIAATGSDVAFVTYSYTPVSSSSYLLIHYHLSKYTNAGTGTDEWYSTIKVDGTEISYSFQATNAGQSSRTGVLFPISGRYTNSSTAAKSITINARRGTADDSMIIDNTSTSMWLRITEIAR